MHDAPVDPAHPEGGPHGASGDGMQVTRSWSGDGPHSGTALVRQFAVLSLVVIVRAKRALERTAGRMLTAARTHHGHFTQGYAPMGICPAVIYSAHSWRFSAP